MTLEQRVNYQLNKVPFVKHYVKSVYQHTFSALCREPRCQGAVRRLSPADGQEYLCGYYDKSPYDARGQRLLMLRAADAWSDPDPTAPADIVVLDLPSGRVRTIATTHTWNVQQGCMAQWLGPDYTSRIIYNDLRDGRYVSVVLDMATGREERVIPCPVYTVSADGRTALSLDFSRLHNLRKGYGYAALPEATAGEALPDATAVWRIDIASGQVVPLFTYRDFASFQPRAEMAGAVHKVNHLMLSPDGQRFMVLHRWFQGQRKYTRLVTAGIDGKDMYCLSDDDMVSHCYWVSDTEILAFENKHATGAGYYLMRDRTQDYRQRWPELCADGHPSMAPDGSCFVTDGYPDRCRRATLRLMTGDDVQTLARVYAPFRYNEDTRCDLHPRFRRDSRAICFDSVWEGRRAVYEVEIATPLSGTRQ